MEQCIGPCLYQQARYVLCSCFKEFNRDETYGCYCCWYRFPVRRDPKRKKIAFYDLRAPNINSLRYHVATHDWGLCLQAVDIQDVYDAFLHTVRMLIAKTVPCHYWTEILHLSLAKTLLSKRRRLRKSGRIDEDVLAEIINLIISETRSKQLAKLSDASPK